MRILIAIMPFEGHREPTRVFVERCRVACPELELKVVEIINAGECSPAELGVWFARFHSIAVSSMAHLAHEVAEFGAQVLLADPGVFAALPLAERMRLPVGVLGNLPVIYLDHRPVLQLTIPDFEPHLSGHSRITYIGPMAELDDGELTCCTDMPRPWIHVTQGTLVTDPGALLQPMRAAFRGSEGAFVTFDHWPDTVVRHAHVFRHLDLLVTTGGYSAVNRAIVAGVPVLVTGTTEDKPAVGERVQQSGLGLYCPNPTPAALLDLCEVMTAPDRLGDVLKARARQLARQCETVAVQFSTRVRGYLARLLEATPCELPAEIEARRAVLRERARNL